MDKEKVTQFLDKLDIEYDLLQHPAAVSDDAIKYFKSSINGLSQEEVDKRLKENGFNELKEKEKQ